MSARTSHRRMSGVSRPRATPAAPRTAQPTDLDLTTWTVEDPNGIEFTVQTLGGRPQGDFRVKGLVTRNS